MNDDENSFKEDKNSGSHVATKINPNLIFFRNNGVVVTDNSSNRNTSNNNCNLQNSKSIQNNIVKNGGNINCSNNNLKNNDNFKVKQKSGNNSLASSNNINNSYKNTSNQVAELLQMKINELNVSNKLLSQELNSLKEKYSLEIKILNKEINIKNNQIEQLKIISTNNEKNNQNKQDNTLENQNSSIELIKIEALESKKLAERMLNENNLLKEKIKSVETELANSLQIIKENEIKFLELNYELQDTKENNKLINFQNKNLIDQVQFLSNELSSKESELKDYLKQNYGKSSLNYNNSLINQVDYEAKEAEIKSIYSEELSNYKIKYEDLISKLKHHFENEKKEYKSKIESLQDLIEEKIKEVEFYKEEMNNIKEVMIQNSNYEKQSLKELELKNKSIEIEKSKLEKLVEEYAKEIVNKDKQVFNSEQSKREILEQSNEKNLLLNKQLNDLKIRIHELEADQLKFYKHIEDLADKE